MSLPECQVTNLGRVRQLFPVRGRTEKTGAPTLVINSSNQHGNHWAWLSSAGVAPQTISIMKPFDRAGVISVVNICAWFPLLEDTG